MNYYFFTASVLPPLAVGVQPEITYFDFVELLEENLSDGDLARIGKLREYIDIQNIYRLLHKRALDSRGNYSQKELDECLIVKEGLPRPVLDFLYAYEEDEERRAHYPELLARYLQDAAEDTEGFLRAFFTYERKRTIVLTAYRCKKMGADLMTELRNEDHSDAFVAQIVAQKDVEGAFDFPEEFEDLGERLESATEAIDEYKVLLEHKFEFAEAQGQERAFSLDYIGAYLVQLIALEDWFTLDNERGREIVEGFV